MCKEDPLIESIRLGRTPFHVHFLQESKTDLWTGAFMVSIRRVDPQAASTRTRACSCEVQSTLDTKRLKLACSPPNHRTAPHRCSSSVRSNRPPLPSPNVRNLRIGWFGMVRHQACLPSLFVAYIDPFSTTMLYNVASPGLSRSTRSDRSDRTASSTASVARRPEASRLNQHGVGPHLVVGGRCRVATVQGLHELEGSTSESGPRCGCFG